METDPKLISVRKPAWQALLYSLPMVLLTFIFMTGGRPDLSTLPKTIAILVAFVLVNVLYFMMHFTGKTDRYRAVLFIIFAVSLSYTLIGNMLSVRNSMSFSQADLIECRIPFCHLVIPMLVLPAVFTKSIIFPGSIIGGFADISSMIVLWLAATLILGRGFCSWGCFYGGWDDGFSRLGKRRLLKKISDMWRWMPFAVLIMVSLTAGLSLVPTYCDWICPFKAVTEFEQVSSVESASKAVIFVSLFLGLVVVLPVLTGKRTQCSFLCPLGALNSLSNRINPFVLKVRKDRCNECFKCVSVCPVFAITKEDIRAGNISLFCSKCGLCADACKTGAIQYGLRGLPAGRLRNFPRNLFLFVSFLFMAVFSSGSIMNMLQGILSHIIN